MRNHRHYLRYGYPFAPLGLFRAFVAAIQLLGAVLLILGMGLILTHCNTESEAERMKAREKAWNDEQAAQTTTAKQSIWDAERQDGRLKVEPPPEPEPPKPPRRVANAWRQK